MESVLLLFDCVAIILVVHWFVRNRDRKGGEPIGGLLRYSEPPRPGAKPSTAKTLARR